MEAGSSYETLEVSYETSPWHVSEDGNIQRQSIGNPESY
jgi:hypothetical protein